MVPRRVLIDDGAECPEIHSWLNPTRTPSVPEPRTVDDADSRRARRRAPPQPDTRRPVNGNARHDERPSADAGEIDTERTRTTARGAGIVAEC